MNNPHEEHPDEPEGIGDNDAARLALLTIAPNLQPIYEFAEGQKAELERRGWSPTAAESAATTILCGLLVKAIGG